MSNNFVRGQQEHRMRLLTVLGSWYTISGIYIPIYIYIANITWLQSDFLTSVTYAKIFRKQVGGAPDVILADEQNAITECRIILTQCEYCFYNC